MQLCVSESHSEFKKVAQVAAFFYACRISSTGQSTALRMPEMGVRISHSAPRSINSQWTECLASNEVARGSNPLCCAIYCPVAQRQSRVLIRLWSLVQVQPGQPRYGSTIGQCAALIRQMMLVRVQPVPPYLGVQMHSSIGQSNSLLSCRFQVRILMCPPLFCLTNRSKF